MNTTPFCWTEPIPARLSIRSLLVSNERAALGLLSRHVAANRVCRASVLDPATDGALLHLSRPEAGRSRPEIVAGLDRWLYPPAWAADLSSSKGTISALSRGMCQRLRIRRGAAVRARNHPVSVSFGPLVSVTTTLAGFWMVQDRSRTAVVEVA